VSGVRRACLAIHTTPRGGKFSQMTGGRRPSRSDGIRSARSCYLYSRFILVPKCPGRTIGDWWARQDLNLGPTDYESAALTAELRAPPQYNIVQRKVSAAQRPPEKSSGETLRHPGSTNRSDTVNSSENKNWTRPNRCRARPDMAIISSLRGTESGALQAPKKHAR
jgi:hypothetical protein